MQITMSDLRELLWGGEQEPVQSNALGGSSVKIVICQRGFVYVGRVAKSGPYLTVSSSSNVRRWGTTKGLGEIAANGPNEGTQLDPAGTVRVHELSVVAMMDCVDERWANAIA